MRGKHTTTHHHTQPLPLNDLLDLLLLLLSLRLTNGHDDSLLVLGITPLPFAHLLQRYGRDARRLDDAALQRVAHRGVVQRIDLQ